MVRGVSGMGKSALVARFLDSVGASVRVLAGRCYEREAVPFKTLDTLIDALTGALLRLPPAQLAAVLPDDITALARLFPVLRRVPAIAEPATRRFQPADPQELRRRGFAALRVLLERLAAAGPVIVAVDDLQWGDLDSVGFLVDLITRPDRPNLLLLLVHRSEDTAGPIVASIEKRVASASLVPDVRIIEVPPLEVDEATDLVEALAGVSDGGGAWASSLVRDAGGNTLFLSELARSATTAGGATTLDELLRDRIARLPPSAKALLRACAVAARPMPAEVVGAAAGIDDVGGALAVLRAERLVRGQADRDQVEPYHDRIRAAVVDDPPPVSCRPRTASWPTPTSTRCRAIASRWSITCWAPASRRPRPSTRSRPRPPPPRRWRSAAPPTCTRSRCSSAATSPTCGARC
jgi:predicted ATPase